MRVRREPLLVIEILSRHQRVVAHGTGERDRGAKTQLVQSKSNRTNDRLKYTRAYRTRLSVFSTSEATIGSFVP